ncbi:MAG: hypothetical protein JXR91_08385 [Deltaproteobacteria bacterium]|nr:hypothetical protein [Deltaproteobacteria bacterium]
MNYLNHKKLSFLIVSLFTAFCFNSVAVPVGPPPQGGWNFKNGLTIGPGAAYMYDKHRGHLFVPSLDATLFHKVKRHVSIWASLGGKLPLSDNIFFVPYFEAGFNFMIFNLGAGYGLSISDNVTNQTNLFLGLALPLKHQNRFKMFVLELYYRPVFNFPENNFYVSNEVGLLFKWLFIFHKNSVYKKD